MKSVFFFTLILFVSYGSLLSQETVADYSIENSKNVNLKGKWEMSIKTPVGTKKATLVINDDNTGVLSDNKIEIEQRGHSIKYKSSRYSWMGTMYMDNTAVIIADKMKGKSVITKGPMKGIESEWTAVRVED